MQQDLRALSEDRTLDWYTRATAVDATVFIGARRGGEALEAELAWLALLAADSEEDWDFRFAVGYTLLGFPRARYRSILARLALAEAHGDLDDAAACTMSLSIGDVDNAYARRKDEPEWLRWEDPWAFYTAEAIAERQLRWRERRPDRGGETGSGAATNDPGARNRRGRNRQGRARRH